MIIRLKDVCAETVLAGAINGMNTLPKLLAQAAVEPPEPEVLFLDFDGIQVATASFLRETVFELRSNIRGRRSRWYPVVANANSDVRDELLVVLAHRGGGLMVCDLSSDGVVSQSVILGDLDPKQQLTFTLIQQMGSADVAELMRSHGDAEGVGATAWNNRLASLTALGLVMETSLGRSKRYRTLFSTDFRATPPAQALGMRN